MLFSGTSLMPLKTTYRICDMQSWGLHCLIDARNGDKRAITDKEHIVAFVKALVEEIDMVAYGPTWIEHFATHDPEKAGISFCQMIETSNITGHFVDKNGNFYLDIFSCKDFSITKVTELVNKWFGTRQEDLRVRVIARG